MPAAATPLLVTPEWLHARLDDPSIRVLDCTTWMTPQPVGPSKITSGRPDWMREHIPGSDHVCMVEDLSDPAGAFPYTLPGEAQIAALLPDVVILGTGQRQKFVHPRLMQSLNAKRIGVECMDNQAACRTYNILMAEGRKVALALILPGLPETAK